MTTTKYITKRPVSESSETGDTENKGADLTQFRDIPRQDTKIARFLRQESPRKDRRDLLKAFHSNPAFYAGAAKIATDISSVKWVSVDKDNEEDVYKQSVLTELLTDPCPGYMSAAQFYHVISLYHDILGEAFVIIDDDTDDPTRDFDLIPVPPTACELEQNGNDTAYWRVNFMSFQRQVPMDRMIEWKSPHLLDPFGRGSGLGHAVTSELKIEEFASRHIASELYNNARPDIVVMTKGMGDEGQSSLKEMWKQRFRGPDSRGLPLFADSNGEIGEIQIHELSRSLQDLGLVEIRKFSQDLIRYVFGIPPEVMGLVENSNRSTITQAQTIYVQNCIHPRLDSLASELQRKLGPLLSRFGSQEMLTYESKLPDDVDLKKEVMKDHPHAFTINEVRALAGHPPLEDGDQLMEPVAKPQEVERSCNHSYHRKSLKKKPTESDIENWNRYRQGLEH